MEIWKDVVGYEGHYQVSNQGQVRRIGRGLAVRSGRVLTPRFTDEGYVKVKLCVKCIAKLVSVHILVAEAFHGPRPSLTHQVNHKNGIVNDNQPDNLEWVTPSQNLQHAFDVLGRMSPRGEVHHNSKLTDTDVREIRRLHSLHQGGKSHEYSYSDLAQRFNVSSGLIAHVVHRRAWKHVE